MRRGCGCRSPSFAIASFAPPGAQAGDAGQLALRFAREGAGADRRLVSSMASTSLSTAR
jgi:hypothetical protein